MRGAYDELVLVSIEAIKKFMNRVSNSHANSYSTNVPIQPVLAMGGYDPDYPRAACAAHLATCGSDLNGLVFALVPGLKIQLANIATEIAAANGNTAALQDKRLFMRKASLEGTLRIIAVSIQCAAARPRDAYGLIVFESRPLHELFDKNPVYAVPFFKEELFLAFKARVEAAEESERSGLLSSGAVSGTACGGGSLASPVAAKVMAHICPRFDALCAASAQQANQLSLMNQQLSMGSTSFAGRSGTVVAGVRGRGAGALFAAESQVFLTEADGAAEDPEEPEEPEDPGDGPLLTVSQGKSRHIRAMSTQKASVPYFGEFSTAAALFNAYWNGPPGRPDHAMRALEAATKGKWRHGSSSNAWYDWGPIARFMERNMTSSGGNEVATIAALQALAVQTGKRGCSKAPDWKQVIKKPARFQRGAGPQGRKRREGENVLTSAGGGQKGGIASAAQRPRERKRCCRSPN